MLDTEAWDVPTKRDRRSSDSHAAQPAFATMEEIVHADELRPQLRARLLRAVESPAGPWSVGVD